MKRGANVDSSHKKKQATNERLSKKSEGSYW